MKHYEGITVRLQHADGSSIKEYDNPNQIDIDDDCFGTRQVGVTPGTTVEIVVKVDDGYGIWSADGVLVTINTGSQLKGLGEGEHTQHWWFDAKRPGVVGEHRIPFWSIWKGNGWDSSKEQHPITMPEPDCKCCGFDIVSITV